MGLKLFGPGGIDQKSNDLLRKQDDLRDAQNIYYSINKEYEKRDGTIVDSNFSGDVYNDVIFIKSLDEYFFRNGANYYSYKNGIKKTLSMGSIDPTTITTSEIYGAEYLKTFIFTHKQGQSGTFKYDGNSIYKAGLPVPDITITALAGTAGFLLSFFDFIDNQGNEIFGPSKIQSIDSLAFVQTVTSPKVDGFYGGYLTVLGDPGVKNYVLNSTNRTLIYNSKSSDITIGTKIAVRTVPLYRASKIECLNSATATITIASPGVITVPTTKDMIAGQTVSFTTTGTLPTGIIANTLYYVKTITSKTSFTISLSVGGTVINTSGTQSGIHKSSTDKKSFYEYILLEVESIIGSSITFTQSSFKDSIINIFSNNSPAFNIMGNLCIRNYVSSSETTGYAQISSTDCCAIDNSQISSDGDITLSLNPLVSIYSLSDVYDITTSKLRPPKCTYITTFGNQLVYGKVISFWNFRNEETTYTNNDLIMYSDISTGDLGENLSELNRQLIGDTYDGEITAMSRVKDSLIIFKNYSIYIIDGILSSGLYALRNILTNQIGCISDKSIISMEDYVMFQGQDGIYGINGYTSTIVSRKLDPYFLTIDPTKTKSVIDSINSNVIFITNIGAIVFNYEYKEWFIWTNIAALNGVTVDNQKQIKMFNGSVAKKFNTPPNGSLPSVINATKNDSGVAINAYLKTAWIDLKEPSLLKKIIGIRFFALKNIGQVLTCRVYHDWDETKVKADFTVDFSTVSIKTILRKLDIQMAQSVSIFISNNVLNQDLRLNGYEVEIGLIQDKDKNVK